jgi:LacI family transcriptional regulator
MTPSRSDRSATLLEVANLAGVSLATASRALNGSNRRVGDVLRERILEAARVLQYEPNAQAQAVARGRSNVVGLVVQDIADPYFSSIAAGVMNAAERHGLLVTLGSTMRSAQREIDYLAALRRQRGRAAILAGSRVVDPATLADLKREVAAFEASGGQVIAVSQNLIGVDTIVLQNRAGGRALARELVALGYQRPAVLAGPRGLITARDRLHGYQDGFAEAGVKLSPDRLFHGPFTRDGGYEAMVTLISQKLDVDCVLGVNDVMTVGAMAACRDHGLALPDDLALAGFDDIETLRDLSPALTTVRMPLELIGETAFEFVVTPNPRDKPRVRRVSGEVIIRESTPARARSILIPS